TGGARGALHAAARALGAELGAEAATPAAVRRLLASRGYEPFDEPDGTIRLRNCPFDRIAARHPELICGINLAILEGLVDQCGEEGTRAVLEPAPGRCCVALTRR
ncbi:MAG TPA: transcriptional regulator, partial [Actinomycetes bacterium]|nr:transcriptional regulator [Actinomycetes bacterium]